MRDSAQNEDRGRANTDIGDVEINSRRRLFSRDVNYLRDVILVWPFLFSSLLAVSLAFSRRSDSLGFGLKIAASAVVFFLLTKERLLIFFAALGFVAFQGTWYLIAHPWSWPTFVATVLCGGVVWLGDRFWRSPKLAYVLPKAYGAIDMLLSVASICATLAWFYFLKHV